MKYDYPPGLTKEQKKAFRKASRKGRPGAEPRLAPPKVKGPIKGADIAKRGRTQTEIDNRAAGIDGTTFCERCGMRLLPWQVLSPKRTMHLDCSEMEIRDEPS